MSVPVSIGEVFAAVKSTAAGLNYCGRLLVDTPIVCRGCGDAWLVVARWENFDTRGNQFNQIIVFISWKRGSGLYVRPYYVSDGPCIDVVVESFVYAPDHDGNIGVQLKIEQVKYDRVTPPWEEDG